jgi:hypothetical protein
MNNRNSRIKEKSSTEDNAFILPLHNTCESKLNTIFNFTIHLTINETHKDQSSDISNFFTAIRHQSILTNG